MSNTNGSLLTHAWLGLGRWNVSGRPPVFLSYKHGNLRSTCDSTLGLATRAASNLLGAVGREMNGTSLMGDRHEASIIQASRIRERGTWPSLVMVSRIRIDSTADHHFHHYRPVGKWETGHCYCGPRGLWLWCGQPSQRLDGAGNERVVVLARWGPMVCLPTCHCNLTMMMN